MSLKNFADSLCNHRLFLAFLGVPRCSETLEPEWASKTKTYTAFLENIWVRYWVLKGNPGGYNLIGADYKIDFNAFMRNISTNIASKTPFNAICSVAYIRFRFVDERNASMIPSLFRKRDDAKLPLLVVDDLTIRPCAIGHGFVERILSKIALCVTLNNSIQSEFDLKVADAKHVLIEDSIKNLKPAKDEYERKETRYDIMVASSPSWYTYIFREAGLDVLLDESPYPTEGLPDARILNDFESESANKKNKLISEMVKDPKAATFANFLRKNAYDDDTTKIPGLLDIDDKKSLQIFKGNICKQSSA